jgi:hypothetical protein
MQVMDSRAIYEQYRDATAQERHLWSQVEGKGPGLPGHDPRVWQHWRDAAHALDTARSRLMASAEDAAVFVTSVGLTEKSRLNPSEL